MGLSLPGRVQVAGVIDRADAELIINAGADMLGFPLGLKDGREDLDSPAAAEIIRAASGRTTAVCITYLDSARDVLALCNEIGARWMQLHGPIDIAELQTLRNADQRLGIIKSLIVKPGDALLDQVAAFAPHVDAFITDTFDPVTGQSGATGKTHDWRVSREIVQSTQRPVILAGGLTPDNVAEAIAAVRPAAVDTHTGAEGPDGRKDEQLVRDFVENARAAFEATAVQARQAPTTST